MIVQCDKCETKFRISDQKVSDSGVKVRCSKCAHVFVVRKEGGSPEAPPNRSATVKVKPETLASIASGSQRVASGPGRAPVLPPAAPTGVGRPAIPSASTTQEAMSALGFGSAPPGGKKGLPPVPAFPTNAEQRPSGLPAFPDSTRRELPSFPSESPTGDRFPETAFEAKTEQMKLPGSAEPKDSFPKQPSSAGSFPPPEPFGEPGRLGGDPFPKAPSSPGGFPVPSPPASDPFAALGSQPGEEPFPKVPSAATDPFAKLGPSPAGPPVSGGDPFAKLGSGPGGPPPASGGDPFAKLGSSPGGPPPASGGDPFAKLGSSPGGPPPASGGDPFAKLGSSPGNPPSPFGGDPFAKLGSSPGDPPSTFGGDPFAKLGSSPGDPPAAPGPDPFAASPSAPDPFADGANPLAQPAGARPDSDPFQNPPAPGPDLHQAGNRPSPGSDPKTGMFPPPPEPDRPRTNVEHLVPTEATGDDPFAQLENEPPSPDFGGASDAPPMTDYLPEEEPFPAASPPPKSVPVARIALGKAGMADGEMSHAKTAIAAAYKEEEEAPKGIGAWPTILGAAVGLAIVLFLFPGLLVGRGLELGALEGLLNLGPRPLLPESLTDVSPEGARVTAYQGREGRRMLVVSGNAHNDGPNRLERIQAVVLMLDGSDVVERRRALVGVPLDEATLAKIGNAQELEAAYQAARLGASPASLAIEPGADARFVVVFPDIPERVEDRRFRVEFVEAPVEHAEKTGPTP